MWTLFFQVMVFFICTICSYQLAKSYSDKFKAALAAMKACETSCGKYRFADYLEFRMYRFAAIVFVVLSYISVALALSNIADLLALFK